MIRRPPRSTPLYSSAASDVYKRQAEQWPESMWRSCIAAGHKAVQHADPALFSGLLGEQVGPWQVDRAVRAARVAAGMPAGFRFHDCRHYFASLLIASGADVKVV